LARIQFVDPFGPGSGLRAARILASGEIVPVPEPTTLFAGLALLTFAGLRRQRRRGAFT